MTEPTRSRTGREPAWIIAVAALTLHVTRVSGRQDKRRGAGHRRSWTGLPSGESDAVGLRLRQMEVHDVSSGRHAHDGFSVRSGREEMV